MEPSKRTVAFWHEQQERSRQLWLAWYRSLGEARLMCLVRSELAAGKYADSVFPDVGFNPMTDAVRFEYRIPHGRIDAAIFHLDGSMTVVEAKDGAQGVMHVLGGIGQATMYALDAGMQPGAPRVIRKGLLWSSTGNMEHETLIDGACRDAGVVPMPYGPMNSHMALLHVRGEKV